MTSIFVENWKALLYGIPFLVTYLIYRFEYRKKGVKKIAAHQSITYSTLFYILGALYLIHKMFESYFIGYILIGLILLLGLILINQWKNDNEVILLKGIKKMWRYCFLVFFMSYFFLLIYHLGKFIYKTFI
ncbi:MAG TPA: DUF3397 family protein [Pseudogracilibacillus sp.]|nr:DUF3397 family protein [Pseudogracilibacillus sp.]